MNIKNKMIIVIAGILLTGCAEKMTNAHSIAEITSAGNITEMPIHSYSFMQQLMDAADNEKIDVVFTPNSSDRLMSDISNGNIFSVIQNSSAINGDALATRAVGFKKKEMFIRPVGTPLLALIEGESEAFLATSAVADKVAPGKTRISFPSSLERKIKEEAIWYDKNSEDGASKGVFSFAKYLSASFAKNKSSIYFGYDKKNNVLFVDETPIAIESTPHKIFILKQILSQKGIDFIVVRDNAIAIKGSVTDWAIAYEENEKLNPFTGQRYAVILNGFLIEVPDGYSGNKPINIEFVGWNKDGTRTYLFYVDSDMRKITTSARVIAFHNHDTEFKIKFY